MGKMRKRNDEPSAIRREAFPTAVRAQVRLTASEPTQVLHVGTSELGTWLRLRRKVSMDL